MARYQLLSHIINDEIWFLGTHEEGCCAENHSQNIMKVYEIPCSLHSHGCCTLSVLWLFVPPKRRAGLRLELPVCLEVHLDTVSLEAPPSGYWQGRVLGAAGKLCPWS